MTGFLTLTRITSRLIFDLTDFHDEQKRDELEIDEDGVDEMVDQWQCQGESVVDDESDEEESRCLRKYRKSQKNNRYYYC